jgi:hypothetical protein
MMLDQHIRSHQLLGRCVVTAQPRASRHVGCWGWPWASNQMSPPRRLLTHRCERRGPGSGAQATGVGDETVAGPPFCTRAPSMRHSVRSAFSRRLYLLSKYVRVPTVLGQLTQDVQIDPSQRKRPSPIALDDVVDTKMSDSLPGGGAGPHVPRSHRVDGVGLAEIEGLIRVGFNAGLRAGSARHGLLEPDPLDEGGVLDQAQQRGLGRHKSHAGLGLGEPVEATCQQVPLFVDERGQLFANLRAQHRAFMGTHRSTIRSPTGCSGRRARTSSRCGCPRHQATSLLCGTVAG